MHITVLHMRHIYLCITWIKLLYALTQKILFVSSHILKYLKFYLIVVLSNL